jgi:hypothetical protein
VLDEDDKELLEELEDNLKDAMKSYIKGDNIRILSVRLLAEIGHKVVEYKKRR